MSAFSQSAARKFAMTLLSAAALLMPMPAAAGAAPQQAASAGAAGYVGAARCAGCHAREAQLWQESHHARSMLPANPASVLGDFNAVDFEHQGVKTHFFRRAERFFVRTDGIDGRLAEFAIDYVFGFAPLQQYLIAAPGGRLQALSIAWDARPAAEGGQRWFHLYPDEQITSQDELHWSGRAQNWNSMCAACHSTDFRKGYDLASDTFASTWAEINVACEACHGPGREHVGWAEDQGKGREGDKGDKQNHGLQRRFAASAAAGWQFAPGARIASWQGAPRRDSEACYPCHARRRQLVEAPAGEAAFLDAYAPTLIEEEAYHVDGQIDGEVFEYASFMQSKMQRAGVVCGDCHEPHSLRLRASGNTLCLTCHQAASFDQPQHHGHAAASPGASCVACHMPSKVYMGVDRRHDHSFRPPRPELSARYGVPDACLACHRDQNATWAAKALRPAPPGATADRLAAALAAARQGQASAAPLLAALAGDQTASGMARASALARIADYPSPAALPALRAALAADDPLLRLAAASAGAALPPAARLRLLGPLLSDTRRSVRIEAARVLADLPPTDEQSWLAAPRQRAEQELLAAEAASAEMPASHLRLAEFHRRAGRPGEAAAALRTALRLAPSSLPAHVNLAELQQLQGDESAAAATLAAAERLDPQSAQVAHAQALLKVRQGKRQAALALLAKAARLAPEATPEKARYGYVYAVALHEAGRSGEAVRLLEEIAAGQPGNREILAALAAFESARGNREKAAVWRQRAVEAAQ